MEVTDVELRSFRNHERLTIEVAAGLSFLVGPNGCGKTSVIEAIHVACTGRSFRNASDRELVRFGDPLARVVLTCRDEDGVHRIEVVLQPSGQRLIRRDGIRLGALRSGPGVPHVCVFAPDHLELVKGAAGVRRAHLDDLVMALWPGRRATRLAYAKALAQRNSLLGRVRVRTASPDALGAWDRELARHGIELMRHRVEAVSLLAGHFSELGVRLGLPAPVTVAYRPRSQAADQGELEQELRAKLESDIDRGFTTHGPHRDDVALRAADRDVRRYGSQGQQRLVLLSLLLAERNAVRDAHGQSPVLLLDDVMSELDQTRRQLLLDILSSTGQALVTTADEAAARGHTLRLGPPARAADGSASPAERAA